MNRTLSICQGIESKFFTAAGPLTRKCDAYIESMLSPQISSPVKKVVHQIGAWSFRYFMILKAPSLLAPESFIMEGMKTVFFITYAANIIFRSLHSQPTEEIHLKEREASVSPAEKSNKIVARVDTVLSETKREILLLQKKINEAALFDPKREKLSQELDKKLHFLDETLKTASDQLKLLDKSQSALLHSLNS